MFSKSTISPTVSQPASRTRSTTPRTFVDLEGDVPEPRTVRGRRQLLSAGGRRVEAHHLEDVAAVGGASHHDLDRHVLQTNDPIDPLAAEHPGLAAVEAEQRKKPDCLVEVLDDKSDVDEVGDAGAMTVHRGQRLALDRRAARSRGYRPRADPVARTLSAARGAPLRRPSLASDRFNGIEACDADAAPRQGLCPSNERPPSRG